MLKTHEKILLLSGIEPTFLGLPFCSLVTALAAVLNLITQYTRTRASSTNIMVQHYSCDCHKLGKVFRVHVVKV